MYTYLTCVSRSSNDEPSESLDDHSRFRLQPREYALEASTQSLEQDVDNFGHAKAPSPSEAQQKIDAKKEIILLTSSVGPPPESSQHTSYLCYSSCFL
jgi:hypothetical protein